MKRCLIKARFYNFVEDQGVPFGTTEWVRRGYGAGMVKGGLDCVKITTLISSQTNRSEGVFSGQNFSEI